MSKQVLRSQYEFMFIGRDHGSFVENYAYDLEDSNESSGKIFINLEIEQNKIDADRIGEIIFDNLRKVFFADLHGEPYERFEEALKEVNKALNAYRVERGSDYLGKLNALIAAVVGSQLYVTQTGDAEAYLIRRKLVSSVSEGLDEQSVNEVFTNIASGDLEQGDWILLCSTRVLRFISKTELAKLAGSNFPQTIENIKDALGIEVLSKTAVIAISTLPETIKQFEGQEIMEGEGKTAYQREEKVQPVSAGELGGKMLDKVKNLNLKGIVGGAQTLWGKTSGKVKSFARGFNSQTERGNQLDFKTWSKEKILLSITILFVILVSGVWWLKAKGDEDKRINDLANKLVLVQEQINSAVTTSQFDKDRANEMLNEAQKQAIEIYNSGLHKAKAGELLQLVADTRDRMDGVLHPKLEQVGDLTEKRANVSALGIISLSDVLYAFEYNALYPLIGGKLGEIMTIDDNEKVISAAAYEDLGSLLFLTESGKILELKDDRINVVNTVDGSFKKGKALEAYGTNKIYILDPEKSQIWKYARRRDSFDTAQAYVTGVDMSKAVDIAIDGNIYILNSDGSMIKLYQGSKEDFPIKKNPAKPLTAPTKIFTNENMNQFYVLEPSEHRVLVYEKDSRSGGINYEKQYLLDEVTDPQDIYVDKTTNTLYVLSKTGIFRTAL